MGPALQLRSLAYLGSTFSLEYNCPPYNTMTIETLTRGDTALELRVGPDVYPLAAQDKLVLPAGEAWLQARSQEDSH